MSDFPLPEPTSTDAVANVKALDIQHDTDPEQDHGEARRIPHLGHAVFFFSLTAMFVLIAQVVVLFAVHAFTPAAAMQHAFALFMAMMAAYAAAFAIAIPVMPLFWKRSFFDGIDWTWRQARLNWWKLLLLGVTLSIIAQLLGHLFKSNATSDVRFLLNTPLHGWITALCASTVVPAVEEIAFRGFLLPALATAYDWLSLDRTPAGLDRWLRTTSHTQGSWIFAAIFSSIAFASLHGSQLHWAAGPLTILFAMSIAFCAVRIHTRSVAAATLVHIAYDALIFVEVIIASGGFRHLDKV